MFESLERMPLEELQVRWDACRALLAAAEPGASGLMAFSRQSIYYLTGVLAQGVFWLPLAGQPVLLLRRGLGRARLESPVERLGTFRSYGDLPGLLAGFGSPLGAVVAVEKSGLSWSLGELFAAKLPGVTFAGADKVLAKAQAVKSGWELRKMRLCGARHHKALHELMPGRIKPGMTERELSLVALDAFFSLGHQGHMRMSAYGEEVFFGHISAGDSSNYPSVFNGPLGLRGEHPAIPFMGYAGKVWKPGEPLAMDIGFTIEGYCTDKTQIYFAGPAARLPDAVRAGHDFCVAVQAYVADNLRPGRVPSAIYAHCVDWAERAGFAEGFMGLGDNKVAFLGHGIGLAIDGHPVIAKGFDEPFETGMVLAVEPKMGIPGVGMVGVENTFEVTETGGVCLTGDDYGIVCVGD
ncbi:MAG: aminopeptidase P family protein [Desulfovibrionaceae bacterium]|nr:aminopeptidase P family protein [Desulfovibrionaceae bacterium]MBF0515302.1 aminopeptidase P family protein [Desulfovibrionaceae bacterium]